MSAERELIERFVECFDVEPAPAGPGDDAAVLPAQGRSCVTTDCVVEDVHFTRKTFRPEDIGHKALAVNLSDLAAMGATPTWFTVSLALPPKYPLRDVVKLGKGMAALASTHGARLVGGNVSNATELSITITASGALHGAPLTRSGGQVGDVLFVSGFLGDAAAGLRALTKKRRVPELIEAQRRPVPQLAFASKARHVVRACIDVSDGLANDLGHLCRASKVGAELNSAALPLSDALRRFAPDEAIDFALRGGEDYVLLVAAPARQREALRALGATEVGQLVAPPGLRVDGKPLPEPWGFQHAVK